MTNFNINANCRHTFSLEQRPSTNKNSNVTMSTLKPGPFKFEKMQAYAHMSSYKKAESQWKNQQSYRFAIFIVCFSSNLQNMKKSNSQNWKIFKKMSKFIKSRNANQCRSQYLKTIQKLSSIDAAVNFYKQNYRDLLSGIQRCRQQLQSIWEQQADQFNNLDADNSPIYTLISRRESIKSQNIILTEPKLQEKSQKQEQLPTASSYIDSQCYQNQKPVITYNHQNHLQNNNPATTNISHKYSFSKNRLQENRLKRSLPSFDDEDNNQHQIDDIEIGIEIEIERQPQKIVKVQKQKQKIGKRFEDIGSQISVQKKGCIGLQDMQSFLKMSNIVQYTNFLGSQPATIQNIFTNFKKKVIQQDEQGQNQKRHSNSQEIRQQRRKAFTQCQKYFLLWTNKLCTIMEEFHKQKQIKQVDTQK